jgi:hypothetical protein
VTKVYGWQVGEKFMVSRFPKPKEGEKPRPANSFDSQSAAVREAEQRGVSIEWLPQ